jgi:hypothetical protein
MGPVTQIDWGNEEGFQVNQIRRNKLELGAKAAGVAVSDQDIDCMTGASRAEVDGRLQHFFASHAQSGTRITQVPDAQWPPASKAAPKVAPDDVKPGIKRAKVNFRPPRQGESGYAGATFNVDYVLIPCFGELHLAYSVVPNSVRGGTGYWLGDRVYDVEPPPAAVTSVKLTGTVTIGPVQIGRFGDGFAAQSLGFGCFSGQTKKVALLKDHLPPNASKEQVQAFIDKLTVYFRADSGLRSAAAESQIRAAQAAAAPPPSSESVEQRKASARSFVQSWQP